MGQSDERRACDPQRAPHKCSTQKHYCPCSCPGAGGGDVRLETGCMQTNCRLGKLLHAQAAHDLTGAHAMAHARRGAGTGPTTAHPARHTVLSVNVHQRPRVMLSAQAEPMLVQGRPVPAGRGQAIGMPRLRRSPSTRSSSRHRHDPSSLWRRCLCRLWSHRAIGRRKGSQRSRHLACPPRCCLLSSLS